MCNSLFVAAKSVECVDPLREREANKMLFALLW